MPRWIVFPIALVLCMGAASLFRANLPLEDVSPALAEEIPLPAQARQPSALQCVGAGSCSAIACHGGPPEGSASSNAYRSWIRRDPHASAFNRLFETRSKQIVQRLDGLNNIGDAHAERDQRCIACHSLVEHSARAERTLLADGVSCEACHGPAETWLAAHTDRGWQRLSAREKHDRWGMNDTKTLATRAQICAGCHVGTPASGDSPARDVNHDLIAAGHPRLTFELSAYLRNLPRHWDDRRERKQDRNYEARVWAVGQLASAQAAIRLLRGRADLADHAAVPTANTPTAWPEFAEYNCFSCHHALKVDRRHRAARSGDAEIKAYTQGSMDWGRWHFATVGLLNSPALAEFDAATDDLRGAMSRPVPDRTLVRRLAEDCERALERMADHVGRGGNLASQSTSWRISAVNSQPANWDEAVQTYLVLAAIQRDIRAATPPASPAEKIRFQSYERVLTNMRELLKLSNKEASNRAPLAVNGPRTAYASPLYFDLDEIDKVLAALRRFDLEQDR